MIYIDLLPKDEGKKVNLVRCIKVYNTRYLSIYTTIFECIDTHLLNISTISCNHKMTSTVQK